ncbi:MAG: adenylate kinase [Lysobacterales bacterium]
MRIVLLGPPGSGKGTQAALLKEELNVPHISTGALLRDAAERGTQLGLQAKALSDKGELVPDDVISGMLEERLNEADVANGFILDGYPRNLAQAKSLDILLARLGQPVEEAVLIDIDAEQIVKRIAKRAQEEGRADDNEETVRNRLRVYAEQTAPVANYYEEKGLLTRVLGDGTIPEIFQRVLSVLNLGNAPA